MGPKVWAERWPHIWKPTSGWTGLINRQSFFHWSAFELNFDRKLQTSWRFSQRTLWITGNVENRQWSLKIDSMIVTIFGCSWHFLDSCAQHPRKKYASDEKLLSPTSIVTRVGPTQLGGHRFHAVSMSMSTPRFSKSRLYVQVHATRVVKWIAKNCEFAKLRIAIAKKSQFRN